MNLTSFNPDGVGPGNDTIRRGMRVRFRRWILPTAAALLLIATSGPVTSGREREPTVRIRWPHPSYRTLQDAIDAAPSGATIDIAPGVYEINEPLTVRGKVLTIQGAGRTRSGDSLVTHLAGPIPSEVVEASRVVGLFNYVGGGGMIKNLRMSGFDACVLGKESTTPQRLEIRGCMFSDSSRGCLWFATSNLVIHDTKFFDILLNGISFASAAGVLHVFDVTMTDIAKAGILINSPGNCSDAEQNLIQNTTVAFCGGPGIVVLDGGACIYNSGVAICEQGGIWSIGSAVWVIDCFLHTNAVVGIASIGSEVKLQDNMIDNTLSLLPDDTWGDGIVVMASPQFQGSATVSGNVVKNSSRAALSNFGAVVSASGNVLRCAAFGLAAQDFLGHSFAFHDLGGNLCGCPNAFESCLLTPASFEPPEPEVPVY